MTKNIVLIGFMGTGKTSTGQLLAARLGKTFLDMDQQIEAETQMPIPEIFHRYGEEHFRDLETNLAQRLSKPQNIVIATGGGTVKRAQNLQALRAGGVIVALHANAEAILRRTQKVGERPVLDREGADDRMGAILALMKERAGLYANADFQVDTSALEPSDVVEEILMFLRREGHFDA